MEKEKINKSIEDFIFEIIPIARKYKIWLKRIDYVQPISGNGINKGTITEGSYDPDDKEMDIETKRIKVGENGRED